MPSVAVLYRVSTKKQAKKQRRLLENDDSLPVQAAVVREFVARHPDWTVVKEYVEEISAFKFSKDDRDIIQQVIRDAMNGVFDILLVFKSDRLSRRAFEYPMILWTLQQSGVTVISVADGGKVLNMKDQPEKLMRFVEGWQSETESINTSIRVKEAMQKLAEKGVWSGGRPPYGFRLSERRTGPALEIHEPEATVIKEMVRLYLEEGFGSKRIAAVLNEKGVRTREGRLWTDTRVRQILQNPIIAGLPAYGRTRPGNTPKSRVRKAKGCWTDLSSYIIPRDENGNPKPVPEYQIVPLETWLRLVEKMKQMNSGGAAVRAGAAPSTALLTGFLVCGHCGRTFKSSSGLCRPNRNGVRKRRRVYKCVTHDQVGGGNKICSGQGSYVQHKIDDVFLKELETFLKRVDPEDLLRYVETKESRAAVEASMLRKTLEAEARKTRRVLEAWTKRLEDYFAAPENSLYSEDYLAARVKEARDKLNRLEAELLNLNQQIAARARRRTDLAAFARRAAEWWDVFLGAPVEVKKRMLSQIIEKVVVYRDRIEIHYCIDLREFIARTEEKPIRFKVQAAL